MAFTYDINTSHNDKKSQNCLFLCHMLNSIVNLFASTFLIAHIYSFNGSTYDYLFNVGVYNLFVYLTLTILCIPIAKLVDKTNRVCIYRLGLIFKALLVIFVIFFGKELAKLLILAGIIYGIAETLYVCSYNVIKQEMVSRKSLGNFTASVYIFTKIIDVICPIILGTMIDKISFSITAIIVLVICIIQVIISIFIKSQKPEGSHHNLKEFMSLLKTNKEAKDRVKLVYITSAVYATVVLTTTLINVCVMLEFGSNFSLGALTSVFAFVSIITLILVKRFTKPGQRTWLYITASVLPLISVIIFVIHVSPITVIILNGAIAISAIIYRYIFDIYRNSTLKETGLYNQIAEHHSIIEIIADSARALCFGLLLLVSLIKNIIAFKIFVVLAILGTCAVLMLLLTYENKYNKTPITNIQKGN